MPSGKQNHDSIIICTVICEHLHCYCASSVLVPPKIYQYFNMTQKIDNSVTLTCLSEGEPPPDMAFRKVTNDYDYVDGENVSDMAS